MEQGRTQAGFIICRHVPRAKVDRLAGQHRHGGACTEPPRRILAHPFGVRPHVSAPKREIGHEALRRARQLDLRELPVELVVRDRARVVRIHLAKEILREASLEAHALDGKGELDGRQAPLAPVVEALKEGVPAVAHAVPGGEVEGP